MPLKPSPTEYLDHLDAAQRRSFDRLWPGLPVHVLDIVFDLDAPGWSPQAVDNLADTLCEYADAFSTSKTIFGECTVMPSPCSLEPSLSPPALIESTR